MSRYSVTLARNERDDYLAWVHELPGCYAYGTSRDQAVANVADAIDRFRDWQRAIGEDVRKEPVTFDIVEAAGAAEQTAEGSTSVLLTWDQESLTPEDWTPVERWLHHSRMEVLHILDGMRDDDLDIAAREGTRSIAKQLQHIAQVEYMYALWTFDFRSKHGLKEFLDWTRRMALERMRALAARRENHLTYAAWAGAKHPEPWTARKAARRLVYHERWHLNSIRRLLQGSRGREASGARP